MSKITVPIRTAPYVMISSDYSQQEPKLTAFVSHDESMLEAFKNERDIYATIAGLAFNLPYEKCLEFHPETGEYQAEGKARRGEAKTIVLGITYGRSVPSIGDQLFGKDTTMPTEEKTKRAQAIYDAVLNAFPALRSLMLNAQAFARTNGFTETILGRRRHLPDMQLPEFEFRAMKGYVNPDIDPLDVSTLDQRSEIPERIIRQLTEEFRGYRYFGQIAKRIKELNEEGIKVINNRNKIQDATRQVVNGIIQGSAADETKMAMLLIQNSSEWKKIGGRVLIPIHDEFLAEVPMDIWEEGGMLLSKLMCDAADFLPFSSKCDVTTTHRWAGLEYPCKYKKPESLETENPDEVKWIQYHLTEMEYLLPVFKEEDGSKPRGDAAYGINGKRTEEMESAIFDYIERHRLKPEEFIHHIEQIVMFGGL